MNKPNRIVVTAAVCVALLGAVGIGYWWGRSRESVPASSASGTQPAERKVLYWYDPMVPGQRFDKPGKSPFMDMPLVPRYAGESGAGEGVSIESGVRQNLGVRTIVVKRGRLAGDIRVPGTIGWDLRQERIVSARVDSIVDRLYVRAPFEPVRAGQPLASVIAPAWGTAIAETHALGQARSDSARALQSASRERLRALGLPAGAGGSRGRITLASPVTGVVSEIGVREGQSAPMGTLMFRVNGTRTVWLEAAIPQAGITGIAAGTRVEAVVDAVPGEVFHGRVETLLPLVDPESRTQRARVVLDNPEGTLVPGMFAQITLQPDAGIERPLVPSDALIGGGAQVRVIVLGDDDRFRPVVVRAGRSSGGMTEILDGLAGGERVVASGQFLIDSEANLSGALQRLGADAAGSSDAADDEAAAPGDGMPADMDMGQPPQATTPREHATHAAPPKPADRKVLYWYDPMKPEKHFDKPGKSPYMDMQLVPRYADEADAPTPERQP